jgi:hypothetical protein
MDRVMPRLVLVTLCLALPACPPGVEGPVCEDSVEWIIEFPRRSSSLVDAEARPTVLGLLHVGDSVQLELWPRVFDCLFSRPSAIWHQTNSDVATLSSNGLLSARSPGVTQVMATVTYGQRTSEAPLSWCPVRDNAGLCNWIAMSGIQVVP